MKGNTRWVLIRLGFVQQKLPHGDSGNLPNCIWALWWSLAGDIDQRVHQEAKLIRLQLEIHPPFRSGGTYTERTLVYN